MTTNSIFSDKEMVIFDLDNTLFDEKSFLKNRIRILLTECNLEHICNEVIHEFDLYYSRLGNLRIIDHLNLSFGINLDVKRFRDLLDIACELDSNLFYQWSLIAIRNFMDSGKKIAICTNGRPKTQELKMKSLPLEFAKYISFVCCNPPYKKPSPYYLNLICDENMIRKNAAVFVGDQASDKLAALLAGIDYTDVQIFRSILAL